MIVGINGFGRIGKQVYRILVKNNIQVRLVNDPNIDLKYLYYLAKYDSVYGGLFDIKLKNESIVAHGIETFLTNELSPSKIKWKNYNVDYVLECSGKFKKMDDLKKHEAKGVIVSCPCKDVPTFVFGVNHEKISNQKVISAASCTTNCIAPIAKLLNDNFEIVEGAFTTVHSLTGSQATVDYKGKNKRISRGCMNIIPSTTGASKSVELVIPELIGKIKGMSIRVPVSSVSVIDFVVKLKKDVIISDVLDLLGKSNSLVMGVSDDEVVSSDFIGDSRSAIIDSNASIQINSNYIKIIAWYDNEYAYSCRMIDLLFYMANKNKLIGFPHGLEDLSVCYSNTSE